MTDIVNQGPTSHQHRLQRSRAFFAGVAMAAVMTMAVNLASPSMSQGPAISGGVENRSSDRDQYVPNAADLAAGLSRKQFQNRQSSTIELWKDASISDELVQRLAGDDDPEVSRRARWILRMRQLGLTADMPAEIAAIIAGGDGADDAALRLLHLGRFDLVRRVLTRSADQPTKVSKSIEIGDYLRELYPQFALLACQQDSVDDLLRLVDHVADSPEMCLCRVDLMRCLGIEMTPQNWLPEHSLQWPADKRSMMETLMRLLESPHDRRRSGSDRDPVASTSRQRRNIRWASADLLTPVMREDVPSDDSSNDRNAQDGLGPLDRPNRFDGDRSQRGNGSDADDETSLRKVDALMMAHWALVERLMTSPENDEAIDRLKNRLEESRQELLEALDEEVRSVASNADFDPQARTPSVLRTMTRIHRYCYALICTGASNDAISRLEKIDPLAAAELQVRYGNFDAAERLIRLPRFDLALPDVHDLAAWRDFVVEAMSRQAKRSDGERERGFANQDRLTPDLQRLTIHVLNLWSVGRHADAIEVADQLWQRLVWLDWLPSEDVSVTVVADAFADALNGSTHWPLMATLLDRHPDTLTHHLVQAKIDSVGGVSASAFGLVSRSLRDINADWTLTQRVALTADLFKGQLPSGDFKTDWINRLVPAWLSAGQAEVQANAPRRSQQPLRDDDWFTLAQMLRQMARPDLAETILTANNLVGTPAVVLDQADRLCEANQFDSARVLFQQIVDQRLQEVHDADFLSRRGTSSNQSVSTSQLIEALIGQFQCDQRTGQQSVDELSFVLRCMLAAPSGTVRNQIAGKFASTPLGPVAQSVQRWNRLAAFKQGSTDGFQSAIRFADLVENMRYENVEQIGDSPAYWYSVACHDYAELDHFWRLFSYQSSSMLLDQAIARKNLPLAKFAVAHLLDTNPIDIDLAESKLEQMRDLDWDSLADEILQRVVAAGRQHLIDHPLDHSMANNLAWVVAVDGKFLNEALSWSRQAVASEPDSTIYRDTLAEVLFRLDRHDEAIEMERACLLDDGLDWHLHRQIERFEKSSETND